MTSGIKTSRLYVNCILLTVLILFVSIWELILGLFCHRGVPGKGEDFTAVNS
jgi:hypothetical protein